MESGSPLTSRKGIYLLAAIALIGTASAIIASYGYNVSATNLMTSAEANEIALSDLFEQWQLAYGKRYSTPTEYAHKFTVFKDNYNFIVNWNSDKSHTSTVGLNEYADLNTEEFSALKSCLRAPKKSSASVVAVPFEDDGETPSQLNWQQQGAVTPVKNQGDCGSCWSFSTTGGLEGLYFINNGNLLSFSEQQLVDCSGSYGNQGCNGGLPDYAYEYSAANGNEQENQYPYTGVQGNCNYNGGEATYVTSQHIDVAQYNPQALAQAAVVNPVSIGIEADQSVFQLYNGGVITSASCGQSIDHAVLVVGYNMQSNPPYWYVKNSWGPSWGLSGYVYIGTDNTQVGPAGVCGIYSMPSYPQ